jgi:hypothetical protein
VQGRGLYICMTPTEYFSTLLPTKPRVKVEDQ